MKLGEGGGDQGDEQVVAIANFLVGGVAYVVEMVVFSSHVHSRSVGGIGDACNRVLGDVCDGVMGFGELQHKSVLSVGRHKSVLLVGKDGSAEPAQSRDK